MLLPVHFLIGRIKRILFFEKLLKIIFYASKFIFHILEEIFIGVGAVFRNGSGTPVDFIGLG